MADVSIAALLVAGLATLVGATIQGAIGFGMNLVAVPVLALAAPELLPVTAIVLGLPVSVQMFRHEHAALDRSGLAWILAGRLPGSVGGAVVVAVASTSSLRVAVGAFVLGFVVLSIVVPPLPVRPGTQLAAGAVSGLTGTAAGIGGPPLALLYQRHRGPVIRSTLAASFLVGTLLSLATLAVGGQVEGDAVLVGALLAPAVVVGTRLGRRFHDVLEQGWLRPAVLVFAAASAVAVMLR